MAITRQNVVDGPGTITLDTTQMFGKEDLSANVELETYDVQVNGYGKVEERIKDSVGKISWRPCGRLTAGILGELYPHGNPTIGASLFGSTDVPAVVHSMDGTKVTWHSAALTKMPGLKLSTQETAFSGDAEITCVVKNGTERTAANSMFTVASVAWAGAFDVDDILGGVYLGTLSGGVGGDVTFKTMDGWDVEFDMDVDMKYAEGTGTYDGKLKGVTVRAKCKPLEKDEDTLLGLMNIQDANAALGSSMRGGLTLTIACTGGLTVILYEAAIKRVGMKWGDTTLRGDEIGFIAQRKVTAGVPAELFSVALT